MILGRVLVSNLEGSNLSTVLTEFKAVSFKTMLLFLLKMDKRLRLQLFVLALVLSAGLLPVRVSAASVKCYVDDCSGDECPKDGIQDCELGYCKTTLTGDRTYRKCSTIDGEGVCAAEFPGGCYESTKENREKFHQCMLIKGRSLTENNTGDGDAIGREGKSTYTTCYCKEDLCNKKVAGGGGGSNKGSGTTTPTFSKEPVFFFVVVGATTAAGFMAKV